MDVAMCRKYKKSERRIFMSNKTRLTKDSRRMDKLLRENGYEVVRKRGGHLIYEKD